jgi:hypothetical protein
VDAYGTGRLAAKDAESAIVTRICEDFNLTPVLGRAHYEQMARYCRGSMTEPSTKRGEAHFVVVARRCGSRRWRNRQCCCQDRRGCCPRTLWVDRFWVGGAW